MAKKGKNVELPGFLEALWRRVGHTPNSQQRRLSLGRIVTTAIRMVEAEGLPALSMARLAEQLGCATMSLYRHVSSKDELHALMMDAAPGEPPSITTDDWAEGLAQWARALRQVYLRHPWILQVPMSGPPLEPGQLAWLDCGLRVLAPSRLALRDRLSLMLTLLYYVRGEAQLAIGLRQAGSTAGRRSIDASYGDRLAQLVDADRFPALANLVAAGVFEDADVTNSDEEFEFGLARIFDGVRALVRSSAKTQRSRLRRHTVR